MPRETPYGAFNFLVDLQTGNATATIGGFSDVSGLGIEINIAEYRNGNEKFNNVRKIPGSNKTPDVTCKRGVVASSDLWDWIKEVRDQGHVAQRDVVITLRDETGQDVVKWKLQRTVPMKWTGPTLAAKGGGDVAMEELVLSAERIDEEVV